MEQCYTLLLIPEPNNCSQMSRFGNSFVCTGLKGCLRVSTSVRSDNQMHYESLKSVNLSDTEENNVHTTQTDFSLSLLYKNDLGLSVNQYALVSQKNNPTLWHRKEKKPNMALV